LIFLLARASRILPLLVACEGFNRDFIIQSILVIEPRFAGAIIEDGSGWIISQSSKNNSRLKRTCASTLSSRPEGEALAAW
jgi:hypothetical protein